MTTIMELDLSPWQHGDGSGLDAFESGQLVVYHADYLKARDLDFGEHHLVRRVREIIQANSKEQTTIKYDLTLKGDVVLNKITYTDLSFHASPLPVGCFRDGFAWCRSADNREMTDKAKAKADDLFSASVLEMVKRYHPQVVRQISIDCVNRLNARQQELMNQAHAFQDAIAIAEAVTS